jgi:hypothetical protein
MGVLRYRWRQLRAWLGTCGRHCLLGLTVSSPTVAPQLAEPWVRAPRAHVDPLWAYGPPAPPPGHPERIPAEPPTPAELELWARLGG